MKLRCPNCGKIVNVTGGKPGAQIACPGCGIALTVPKPRPKPKPSPNRPAQRAPSPPRKPAARSLTRQRPAPPRRSKGALKAAAVVGALALVLGGAWGGWTMLANRPDPLLERGRAKIQVKIDAADQSRTRRDVAAAKLSYEAALHACQRHLKRFDDPFIEEKLDQVQQLLDSDEIKLGGQGYVQFGGRWITPEEKEKIDAEQFAAQQAAKGLVPHEGRWVTPAQKRRIMGQTPFRTAWFAPQAKASILDLEAKRLRAQAAGLAPIETEVGARLATAIRLDPAEPCFLVDNFEGPLAWRVESWGDAAKMAVVEQDGTKWLALNCRYGQEGKNAITRAFKADISSRTTLGIEAANETPERCEIAIGISIGAGFAYFESPPARIEPGQTQTLRFSLQTSNFKSEATSWNYQAKPSGLEATQKLTILLYPRAHGVIKLGKIELLRE